MDEDVSLLIQNFDYLSSPVQETLDHANRSILELIQNDPMLFLFLSAQIIHIDGLKDSIYRAAITLMGHALTPSLKAPIQMIQSVFLDPSNTDRRKLIKEAAFRGLMFTDQSVRQQASYCVNLIFQMETDQWSELIPSLYEVANSSSSQYSMEAHCGAIYCFKNIIQSNIPMDFSGFMESFYFLVSHILLGVDISSEALYNECFECYISILDNLVLASKIDNEIVIKCFEIIEKSINNFGLAKTNFYLSALFCILKGVYSTSIFDYLDKFLELSKQILENGDFKQQISVILWWDDIARFELRQKERSNIIDSIAESFFPIILKVISVGFQSVDDFDDFVKDMFHFDKNSDRNETSKQVLNAGHNCLKSFFKAAPAKVFSCVSQLWNSENFSDQDQVICALFCLRSILTKNIWNDKLFSFIEDTIKEIVLSLIMNDNPYISILAVVLISKSISKFGCFVRGRASISSLLDEILKCSEKNSCTILYCCDVIYKMCSYASSLTNDSIDNSIISGNCDQILRDLNFFVSQASSPDYILGSFSAFSIFICILPISHFFILSDIQENIIKKTIIQTLSGSDELSDEILFALQNSMISMIVSVATAYSIRKMKIPNATELIRLLFAIVNQKNTTTYEETLQAFSSIIICIKEDYSPFITETMDMILVMLGTGNPSIIENAINTITDLFRLCGSQMKDYTSPVFKLMIPMIYEGNLSRELIIAIVMTLTDVITSANDVDIDNKAEFFKVLIQLKNTVNLDPANKIEIEFINKFFESIFYSLSQIINKSLGDEFLAGIEYSDTFEPLIFAYLKFKIFDPSSYYPYMLFIQSMANLYGKSIMKKINNRHIRDPISDLAEGKNLQIFGNIQIADENKLRKMAKVTLSNIRTCKKNANV